MTNPFSSKCTDDPMNRSSDSKGFVLLVVLGILALMSVLALAFVSMTRLEKKIAQNNAREWPDHNTVDRDKAIEHIKK